MDLILEPGSNWFRHRTRRPLLGEEVGESQLPGQAFSYPPPSTHQKARSDHLSKLGRETQTAGFFSKRSFKILYSTQYYQYYDIRYAVTFGMLEYCNIYVLYVLEISPEGGQ